MNQYFKIGEVAIHKGTPDGRRIGEEVTILSDLIQVQLTIDNVRQTITAYHIETQAREPRVAAQQHELMKKYPPSERTFGELMAKLNTEAEA